MLFRRFFVVFNFLVKSKTRNEGGATSRDLNLRLKKGIRLDVIAWLPSLAFMRMDLIRYPAEPVFDWDSSNQTQFHHRPCSARDYK